MDWSDNKKALEEFSDAGIIISEKVLNHIKWQDRWYIWNNWGKPLATKKLNEAKAMCEENYKSIKKDNLFDKDFNDYLEKK